MKVQLKHPQYYIKILAINKEAPVVLHKNTCDKGTAGVPAVQHENTRDEGTAGAPAVLHKNTCDK